MNWFPSRLLTLTSFCILASATCGAAGDSTPSRGSPTGRIDSPTLPNPQIGGVCVEAAKQASEKSTSAWNGNKPNIQFLKPIFVIEAETLFGTQNVQVNGGSLAVQQMAGFGPGWGNDAQLFWSGGEVGAVLDLTFSVPIAGYYSVYLYPTRAPDFGQVKAQVKGAQAGWIPGGVSDGWAPTVKPPTYSQALGPGSPEFAMPMAAGNNKLSLMIIGKNEKSTGYFFGIDCVVLRLK